MKIVIGDVVRYRSGDLLGKVIDIEYGRDDTFPDEFWIGVDFGPGFRGHDLGGRLETHTGWWGKEHHFDIVKRKTLVYLRSE